MRLTVALAATLFIFSPAAADTLKIATWNIEHLRDGIGEGPNARQEADFERLALYAEILDADVIAFQEIETLQAARKVFKPTSYQLFIENRTDALRTGFAVRQGIPVIQHPDFAELNVSGGLRHGTDITLTVASQAIRLLSVHLRSGCWGKSLNSNTNACKKLKRQLPALERWIDARAAEGIPFIVMGDFNRRFDVPGDEFWPEIDDGEPVNADLHRITEGRQQGCWDGVFTHFIDHIVFDKTSRRWIRPFSFEEIVYEESERLKKKLSDHCPVAVTLEIR
jgi:exonuclease III